MDTILGVKKTEFSEVIRDGFHNQGSIRWKINHGGVFFADKVETRLTTVLGLPACYPEWETNIRTVVTALNRWAVGFKSLYG